MRLRSGAAEQLALRATRLPPEPIPHISWTAAILQALPALQHGGRTVCLTGPPGTGKTMLLRQVARLLEADGIGVELLLHVQMPLPPSQISVASPVRPRVLVDEADHLHLDEMTRVLSCGADGLMLAGVVFSEAAESLLPTDTLHIALKPLLKDELLTVLAAHLAATGQRSDFFTAEAVERLAEHSEGILRLIVSLADASAWLAAMSASPHVTAEHVGEAAMLRQGKGFEDVEPPPMEAPRTILVNVPSIPADQRSLRPSIAEAWHRRQAPVPHATGPEEIPLESLPTALDEPAATLAYRHKQKYAGVSAFAVCVAALSAFWLQGVTQHGQSELPGFFESSSEGSSASVDQTGGSFLSAPAIRPGRQADAPMQPASPPAGRPRTFLPDPLGIEGTAGPAIAPGPTQFGLAASEFEMQAGNLATMSPQPTALAESAESENPGPQSPLSSAPGASVSFGPAGDRVQPEAERRTNEAGLNSTPTPSSQIVVDEVLPGASEPPPGQSPAEEQVATGLHPARSATAPDEATAARRPLERMDTAIGTREPSSRPFDDATTPDARGRASLVESELAVTMPLPLPPPARMPDTNRASVAVRAPVVPQRAVAAQGRSPVRREAPPILAEPAERCRIASFRFQLGRPLSQADRDFVRHGCRPG